MAVRSRFMSLPEIATAIARDRREPDKVLTYSMQLDRVAHELADVLDWAEKPEGDAYLRLSEAHALLRSIVGEAAR